MPRRDGTGPAGGGSMTGKGMGPCGMGMRMGYGRGFGLGQNYGCRNKLIDYSIEEEKSMLKKRLEEIEQIQSQED